MLVPWSSGSSTRWPRRCGVSSRATVTTCIGRRRWGLKAWFGGERPTREHYEAQLIAPDGVDGAIDSALEIGFHAEHPDAEDNDAAIARLMAGRERWRATLGEAAVVGRS